LYGFVSLKIVQLLIEYETTQALKRADKKQEYWSLRESKPYHTVVYLIT